MGRDPFLILFQAAITSFASAGGIAMIGMDQMMDVRDFNRQGHSIRAIARITGLSRNTIRGILRGERPPKREGPPRASKLDPFKDYLRRRRAEYPLSAVRLLTEIRPMGFDGSVIILRRFLATLDEEGRRDRRLTVRFETPPGQQAQVDWGQVGYLRGPDGRSRPVYVFAYVLSFSRMLFVRFTTSTNLETLIDCHQKAFDYLGGWPRQLLYDNMKQVRLGPGRWNPAFADFADHHGFTPKTHRPYRPRTKGKVERAVDYVKDSFVLGRHFADLDEMNAQALSWLETTANVRQHATTGRRPVDLLPQEGLIPAGSVPAYRFAASADRTASFEAMVTYEGSRYSVPPAFAGKAVRVSALGGQVVIRAGDTVIAEHREAAEPGQCVADPGHIAELWKFTNEHVRRPPHPAAPLIAAAPVQRVDLRLYEEVTA
jgi:transposase